MYDVMIKADSITMDLAPQGSVAEYEGKVYMIGPSFRLSNEPLFPLYEGVVFFEKLFYRVVNGKRAEKGYDTEGEAWRGGSDDY